MSRLIGPRLAMLALVPSAALAQGSISQQTLASPQFRTAFVERLGELTGLMVSVGPIQADADMNFSASPLKMSASGIGPDCTVEKVSGQLRQSQKLVDIVELNLNGVNCTLPVDVDGRLMGVNPTYRPRAYDVQILAGAEISKLNINSANITIERYVQGKVAETTSLANLNLSGGTTLTLAKQVVNLHLRAKQQPVALTFQRSQQGPRMTARIKGTATADWTLGQSARFEGNLTVRDQDLIPTLDTDNQPLTLEVAGTWDGSQNVDFSQMNLRVGEALQLRTTGKMHSVGGRITASMNDMAIMSGRDLRELLMLPPATGRLLTISGAQATLDWDDRQRHDFKFTAELGSPQVRLAAANDVEIKRLRLSIETDSRFGTASVPFSLDLRADEVSNRANNIFVRQPYVTSRGTLKDAGSALDLDSLLIGATPDGSRFAVKGSLSNIDTDNWTVNLTGDISQSLEPFQLGDNDVDGRVFGPFEFTTNTRGDFVVSSELTATINRIAHPSLQATDLRATARLSTRVIDGFHSDLVNELTPDRLLDEAFDVLDDMRADITLTASRASFVAAADDITDNFDVDGLEAHLNYFTPQEAPTSMNGSVKMARLRTVLPDGSDPVWLDVPATMTWDFIPDGDRPGFSWEVHIDDSTRNMTALTLNGSARLRGTNLEVDYRGKTHAHTDRLARVFGIELMGQADSLAVDGMVTLDDFFFEPDLKSWDLRAMEMPYGGRIHGRVTASLEGFQSSPMYDTDEILASRVEVSMWHDGDTARQDINGSFSVPNVSSKITRGNAIAAEDVTGSITGYVTFPMPSEDGNLRITGTAAKLMPTDELPIVLTNVGFDLKSGVQDGQIVAVESVDSSFDTSIIAH